MTNKVTMAWNAAAAQRYTTYDGRAIDTVGTVIWPHGTTEGRTYTGGYSTVANRTRVAASWPRGARAAMSRLRTTVTTGGTGRGSTCSHRRRQTARRSARRRLADSDVRGQRLNDEPSIVATDGATYIQFNGYTSSYASYDVFAIVGSGDP